MHSKVPELGSKLVLVQEVHSRRVRVLALGSKQVLVLALGSKQVLVPEQELGSRQVLEQELGSKQVLEQELGSKQVPELGSKLAQALGSIEIYACSICQKVRLLLGLLKLPSKRSSPTGKEICSSGSPKCLKTKLKVVKALFRDCIA